MIDVAPRRIFARRGVDMVHDEIVWLNRRAKRIRRFAWPAAAWPRHEWNNFRTHAKISQSTMRVSPPIASAIRQAAAVMRASASVGVMIFRKNKTRGTR